MLAPSIAAPRATAIDRPRPEGWRLTLGILLFTVAGNTAYWVTWFFGDRRALATLDSPAYETFESAFVLADAWMALCCAAGAVALVGRAQSTPFWILLASSAGIYLAAMDIAFDLQNDVYFRASTGPVLTELLINTLALAFGTWGIRFSWLRRREWLEGSR